MKISRTIFAILFLCQVHGKAQDSCSNIISQARIEYEKGQFHNVINNLDHCIKSSENKVIRWQGYKLMSMCYLHLNQTAEARAVAINMLELNPLYKPGILSDEKEFINLLSSIHVIPRFSITVSGIYGVNFSSLRLLNSFSLTTDKKTYKGKTGFDAGIFLDYFLSRHIVIQLGAFAAKYNFSFTYAQQDPGTEVDAKEHLNYFEFPFIMKYLIGNRRLQPYLELGGFYGYLNTGYLDLKMNRKKVFEQQSTNNSIRDIRKPYNYGLTFGPGISYKLGSGSVFLDCRFVKGFVNLYNNKVSRYQNNHQSLMYAYYYVPDDFSLDKSVISVGYVFYINYRVLRNEKNKFL